MESIPVRIGGPCGTAGTSEAVVAERASCAGALGAKRSDFVLRVRTRGGYPSLGRAEQVSHVVLALFGAHLLDEIRSETAARLPDELAAALLNPLPSREPFAPSAFVHTVTAWLEGSTRESARTAVGTVLSVVSETVGPQLRERLLRCLPDDAEALFAPPVVADAETRTGGV